MADHIERVIADVRRYRVATNRLIAGLQNQIASSDTDIATLQSGITMADKMRRSGSAELSRDLTQRLDEFEAVRREIRISITAALLAEGLSTAEIGETFGVTRQLANRFVKDARARTGSASAPRR
ncbi:MAG: hypothetical protein ABSF84_01585 [Acidimicrobiales bacterium]|jgi:predicted XRE-type DNA-binding protein